MTRKRLVLVDVDLPDQSPLVWDATLKKAVAGAGGLADVNASGTLAARPAIGTVEEDFVYFATDTQQAFVARSGAWQEILLAGGGSGITDQADAPVAPSDGQLWLDSDDETGLGNTMWEKIIENPLTSIAGFTSVAGTWAANAGGYVEQTSTGATYYGTFLDAEVHPGSGLVSQVEVRFPTSAVASRRGMLSQMGPAAVSGINALWAGLRENVDGAVFQRGDQTAETTEAFAVGEDTWRVLRVALLGHAMTLSMDGVLRKTWEATGFEGVADRLGLITYQGPVHFRNLNVWRLREPV